MAIGVPSKKFIGMSDQTTGWSTAETITEGNADVYMDTLAGNETLSENQNWEFLRTYSGNTQRIAPIKVSELVEGSLPFWINYEGLEWALKQALGEHGGSDPVKDASDDAWTWTFTPGATIPYGLTIAVNRDVKKYVYAGCKINKTTLEFVGGQCGKITFDIIGYSSAAPAAADTAASCTFATYKPTLHSQGDIKIDTTSRKTYIKDTTVVIDNNLKVVWAAAGGYPIEPQYTAEGQKVSGTSTVVMDSTSYSVFWANAIAETAMKMELLYTGALIDGTTYYAFNVTIPKFVITGMVDPIDEGDGLIGSSFSWEAYFDLTNDQIKIEVVNSNGSAL